MSDAHWSDNCEVGVFGPDATCPLGAVASVVLFDQGQGYVTKEDALVLSEKLGTLARREDPRPSDPAELARQVAMELRTHSLFAAVFFDDEPTTIYVQRPQRSRLNVTGSKFPDTYWAPIFPFSQEFDGMGPVAIADEIQRQEAVRAREWTGDP
jgi:hypothetical protein